MLPLELEQYMHKSIPLSKAMAVSVVSLSDGVVTLHAPLEPNRTCVARTPRPVAAVH